MFTSDKCRITHNALGFIRGNVGRVDWNRPTADQKSFVIVIIRYM